MLSPLLDSVFRSPFSSKVLLVPASQCLPKKKKQSFFIQRKLINLFIYEFLATKEESISVPISRATPDLLYVNPIAGRSECPLDAEKKERM